MKKSIRCLTVSLALMSLSGSLLAETLTQAAIVPGADLVLSIKTADLNQTPFIQAVQAKQAEMEILNSLQQENVQKALGIEEEDLLAYMVSAQLPESLFRIGFDPGGEDLANLQMVIGVELNKSVTLEQLKQAIDIMQEDGPSAFKATLTTIAGREVIKLESTMADPAVAEFHDSSPLDDSIISLSDSGKLVLLTLNENAMTSAHNRLNEGITAAPAAGVSAAMEAMGDSQIRMALVIPPAARQALSGTVQQLNAADPMMGMMAAPFAGLSSITFSGRAAEDMSLALNIDMGNDMAAMQVANMIRSFGPAMTGPASDIFGKITPEAVGTVLRISGVLTPEDMKPLTFEAP